MNRVLAGAMVIIASIAGFMMVASQRNVPEGVLLFTGIAMVALGIGGLALLLSDGEMAGDRTSNHHTEVHVHGQGQPAWMDRPQAPPQPIFMMVPQHAPQAPGVTPEMMHHMMASIDRRLQEAHHATRVEFDRRMDQLEHARYTGHLPAPGQFMGQLAHAPDGRYIDVEHRKALPAPRGPSLATQGLRLLFKGKTSK